MGRRCEPTNKSRARLTCHSHASLGREHRTMIGLLRSSRRPFSFRRSVPQTRTPTISSHLSSVCRVKELPSQSKIQKLYGTAFSWAFFLHPRREYSRENGQRAKGKGFEERNTTTVPRRSQKNSTGSTRGLKLSYMNTSLFTPLNGQSLVAACGKSERSECSVCSAPLCTRCSSNHHMPSHIGYVLTGD